MTLAPAARMAGSALLIASASSPNVKPAMPDATTMFGVSRSTTPTRPTLMPLTVSMVKPGMIGLPVTLSITFAPRYVNLAPPKFGVNLQALVGCGESQPPFC